MALGVSPSVARVSDCDPEWYPLPYRGVDVILT